MKRQDIFPTAFWSIDLGLSKEKVQDLLTIVEQERASYQGGEQRSAVLGWQSKRTIPELYDVSYLTDKILEAANSVTDFLQWDMDNHKLQITNLWFNINGKNALNRVHNHSNSFLSGVYYLCIPDPAKSGNLFFSDPRGASQQFIPPYKARNAWTASVITAPLEEGALILFPSWLQHGVSANLGDAERVSISFNINLSNK